MRYRGRKSGATPYHSTLICEGLEDRTLLSAVSLIKDINTGTLDSNPHPLMRIGSTVFASADDGLHGRELYRTDGTAAGTQLLVDSYPGGPGTYTPAGAQDQAVAFNGKCYFISDSPSALSLSVTDGTPAGTSIVKVLDSSSSNVSELKVVGSKMFLIVNSYVQSIGILWVSDGTAAGTMPASQLASSIGALNVGHLMPINATQLFLAATNTTGSAGMYLTDDTLTSVVQRFSTTTGLQPLFACNGRAVFIAGSSSSGPVLSLNSNSTNYLETLTTSLTVTDSVSSASRGYFIANRNLYKTDGTAAGTTVVTAATLTHPGMGMLSNGSAIFEEDTAANSGVVAVMRSDGTAAGTVQLTTYAASTQYPNPNDLTTFSAVGTRAVFRISSATHASELWSTDGTVAGTTQLVIDPRYNSNIQYFMQDGGSPAFFSARDANHGQELWKTDGTLAGTALYADINLQPQGSDPGPLTPINGKYWFIAGNNGVVQPWITDLTTAGTTPVTTDPTAFENSDNVFVNVGTKVYFAGFLPVFPTSVQKRRLFTSTGSGISVVTNAAGYPQSILDPILFNGGIYVAGSDAAGPKLWKTDGTTAGTVVVSGSPALESYPVMTTFGNYLFFVGANRTLYSLSTTGTLTALTTFSALDNSILSASVGFNGALYFLASTTAGTQLWKTDGTTGGTTLVKTVTIYRGPASLLATAGVLYIGASDGGGEMELRKSDGTAAGTPMNPFDITTDLTGAVAVNGKLYYTSYVSPFSLKSSDGTAAGTTVLQITSNLSVARTLSVIGNYVYFSSSDAAHGMELWRTDGTPAGTVMAVDINPGAGGSQPRTVQQIGNALVLSADDGVHGNELVKIAIQDFVLGTTGNDTVTLTQNTDHAHIDWHIGADAGQIAINDAAGLTINGNGGADTITLVGAGALPNVLHLNGTFTLNGLTRTNPLANTTLDINASTLFLTYASPATDPLATIRGYLKNGYNAGLWTGVPTASTGVITSSAAAADSTHAMAIGYADSADGIVPLPANTIELRYTLYGDTSLTESVGFTDFMRMTQHYTLATGANWGQGDFNYDGIVNSADFNLLQRDYGVTLPAPTMSPIVVARGPSAPPTGSPENGQSTVAPPAGLDSTKAKKHIEKKHTTRHKSPDNTTFQRSR